MRTEARRERVLTAVSQPGWLGSLADFIPLQWLMKLPTELQRNSHGQASAVTPPLASPAPITPAVSHVEASPPIKAPLLRLVVVLVIAASGLFWDLWTKHQVFAWLGFRGVHPVWKGQILGMSIRFQLETTFNYGALWGIGQGKSWLFASLSFVALAAIAWFLWNRQAIATRWLTVVTGLLLAGTLGNLFDRLGLHGWKSDEGTVYAVRDFLDFYFFNDSFHWATFNFADSYLVIGACMLVIHSFWFAPAEETAKQP